jgi:hypothetical protein
MRTTRRRLLKSSAALLLTGARSRAAQHLPLSQTFVGTEKYQHLLALAEREAWHRLPISQRLIRIARQLEGTPYTGFTLEIDDHIESPSANFDGLDCWTFFETTLGLARLLTRHKPPHTPADLLAEIEHTRYRHGRCRGNYLDRIHYLDEWFADNQKRQVIQVITSQLGPTTSLQGRRRIDEMTVLWKSYRYLKNDPSLLPGMRAIEASLEQAPFDYLPKQYVAAAESRLQDGDIIGIVTHKPHVYCSHVGLALRDRAGVLRLMHASSTHGKVVIDSRLTDYLARFKSHAGIIAARPLEAR